VGRSFALRGPVRFPSGIFFAVTTAATTPGTKPNSQGSLTMA